MAEESRSGLQWFDCNARFGRWGHPMPGQFTELDDLLAMYDDFGIAGGLVHHAWAWEWAAPPGNERLLADTAGHERLRPCLVALPGATREIAPPVEFARGVRQMGGAVRIFPKFHNWRVNEWGAGALFEALAENAVPVLVDFPQTTWDDLAWMVSAHPSLPVILLGMYYRVDRHLYALWEQYRNLYVEANTYAVFRGIEAVCERFGPERFVFGTGLPTLEPGGPIAQIVYAEIPEDAKRLIAGENMLRLLGEGSR